MRLGFDKQPKANQSQNIGRNLKKVVFSRKKDWFKKTVFFQKDQPKKEGGSCKIKKRIKWVNFEIYSLFFFST